MNGRPNDQRQLFGIIGRVLGGVAEGLISGNPIAAITGGIRGAIGPGDSSSAVPGRLPVPQIQSPVPGSRRILPQGNFPVLKVQPQGFSGPAPGGRIGSCGTGFFFDQRSGQCIPLQPSGQVPGFRGALQRFLPGGETGFHDFGEAQMSGLGAGLSPGVRPSSVRVCPRGTVLGKDGLCHNKRDIRNSDREWPRGRRPLLTGGELKAISTASRAAGKLQRKQKQLEDLGLLKKAAPRKRKSLPAHHHHQVTSG